jgi:uncharacterized Tic20 family protein
MKTLGYSLLAGVLAAPVFAFAQNNPGASGTTEGLQELGTEVITIINTVVVPLIFAVAFVVFLIALMKVLAGKEDDRKKAVGLVVTSIVVLAVMISVWGLVNLVLGTFDLDNQAPGASELPSAPSIRN